MTEWVGVLGGAVGVLSFFLSLHQWWKVNKKIAMLSDASKAAEILPAWYIDRMMQDDWLFGLLTADGRTIAITKITGISDDGKWMDVELAAKEDLTHCSNESLRIVGAVAPDRIDSSIQISSIVAAIELQTS